MRWHGLASARGRGTRTVLVASFALSIAVPVAVASSTTQGSGSTGAASVKPSFVDFGNVVINTTVTKQVTITVDAGYKIGSQWTGTGIGGIEVQSSASHTCVGFVGPGTCSFSLSFSPTKIGGGPGTLTTFECPTHGTGPCTAIAVTFNGNGVKQSVPAATNTLVFSGALKGTVASPNKLSVCDVGTGGMQWPLDATLSPSTAHNWSLTLIYQGNGTYKKFVFGGKDSFVLQSGFNGWVATSGSFTVHGKTGTADLTLGAHEGSATGTVYVKGGWTCG